MFDHVGFNVSDFARSKVFYLAALEPLGMRIMREGEKFAVIGNASGRLWIGVFGAPATPIHFAFGADDRNCRGTARAGRPLLLRRGRSWAIVNHGALEPRFEARAPPA